MQSALKRSDDTIEETGRLRISKQKDGNPDPCRTGGAVSDTELIRRSLEGDELAFRVIVERYQDRVAATAIGMLGHGDEAEEVGQESFIRLYRSLANNRGESSLGTYLTRIAINLSLDAARRGNRRWPWI